MVPLDIKTHFFFGKKIYLLFSLMGEAVLGLHCCKQAFSSCGEQGLRLLHAPASHCSEFSCCGTQGSRCTGFSNCSAWAQ